MASRPSKYHGHPVGSQGDEKWLRTVWDWAREIEREHGLLVQVSLYATRRLGVWRSSVRALEMVDGRPAGIRVQLHGEYPNAQAQSLGAYLYGQLVGLERLLGETGLGETG